jgi:hypothetical protein
MRPLFAVFFLLPAPALAQHLLVNEVGYDVVSNPEVSEFIEILNPTDQPIVLNDGTAGWYVSDDEDIYWNIVNGPVVNSSSDWVLTFPVGAVLEPHGLAVIVEDSDDFLAEFFPGGLATFESQPGSPQLFEMTVDLDTVPEVTMVGNTSSMSLTNDGEDVVIFHWDGRSDLVEDGDVVCWVNLAELPDKSAVSIDGPDVDAVASTYLPDLGTAVAALDAGSGESTQRRNAIEYDEVDNGGNGFLGHDETTEDWSTSFSVSTPTPGRFLFDLDGDLSDLAAASEPLAVSPTDGPGSGTAVLDYGADGSVSELYAVVADLDGNGTADHVIAGVRGQFFTGSPGANGTFLLIDVDPGSGVGATAFAGGPGQPADYAGLLDSDLTQNGGELSADRIAEGIGFDAAAGITADGCTASDTCGIRGFGTDGVAGLLADFAWLGDVAARSDIDIGDIAAELPGAVGTTWAGPEGFEIALDLADLGNPTRIALAVVTSADFGNDPSPNTLPESAQNTFGEDVVLDTVACLAISGPAPGFAFPDSDGDGYGTDAGAEPLCGLLRPGFAAVGGDCDDGSTLRNPGHGEDCDGLDNDCDGNVDEDFDVDGDGAFVETDTNCVLTYPPGSLDCDDLNPNLQQSSPEVCDGADNDCDQQIDNGFDLDGDGAFMASDAGCATTYGTGADCDDTDAAINPSAAEVCNATDDDCEGGVDEGFDGDGDGWFNGADPGCAASYLSVDCADGNAGINPGAAETCDGNDEDCDFTIDEDFDVDADGYTTCEGDCDDANGAVSPGAVEDCANTVDDDCDGEADGADLDCAGDDDDATADDDDATADDDDATADDDDATDDDDDATADDDDSYPVGDDDDGNTEGCGCGGGGGAAALLLAPLPLLRRRRR